MANRCGDGRDTLGDIIVLGVISEAIFKEDARTADAARFAADGRCADGGRGLGRASSRALTSGSAAADFSTDSDEFEAFAPGAGGSVSPR